MYVGVILNSAAFSRPDQSIPHVCGGDPATKDLYAAYKEVFPMYVGVIPSFFR